MILSPTFNFVADLVTVVTVALTDSFFRNQCCCFTASTLIVTCVGAPFWNCKYAEGGSSPNKGETIPASDKTKSKIFMPQDLHNNINVSN